MVHACRVHVRLELLCSCHASDDIVVALAMRKLDVVVACGRSSVERLSITFSCENVVFFGMNGKWRVKRFLEKTWKPG